MYSSSIHHWHNHTYMTTIISKPFREEEVRKGEWTGMKKSRLSMVTFPQVTSLEDDQHDNDGNNNFDDSCNSNDFHEFGMWKPKPKPSFKLAKPTSMKTQRSLPILIVRKKK
jgi:hypothetical protein